MSLSAQAESASWRRAGDDRDLVERVLAIEPLGQGGAADRLLVGAAHLVLAEGAVHQQADQLRIGEERAAVWMIGREHQLPRILAEQEQLQPDPPLQSVD